MGPAGNTARLAADERVATREWAVSARRAGRIAAVPASFQKHASRDLLRVRDKSGTWRLQTEGAALALTRCMLQQLSRGFALIEALVAALLVATAVAGLAQLVSVGLAQSSHSRQATMALTAAQAKLEELRSLAWHFALDGARVSSVELSTSPPGTLTQNLDGWFERLDRYLAPGALEDDSHYWRRWAIAPVVGADDDTLRLQVCVFTSVRPGDAAAACVWGIRTRKP